MAVSCQYVVCRGYRSSSGSYPLSEWWLMLMLVGLFQQQKSKNINTGLRVGTPCSRTTQKGQLRGVLKVHLVAPSSQTAPVVLCCLLVGNVGTLLLPLLASVNASKPYVLPDILLCFHQAMMYLCPSKAVFDLSDEDITIFSLSAMLFDVVSSLLVCLHGTRAGWSCLAIYPFKIDYDSTCICGSLHIVCCISLMVRAVGRQVRTMASIKFSVSISKALISLYMFLVCLER